MCFEVGACDKVNKFTLGNPLLLLDMLHLVTVKWWRSGNEQM